MFVLFISIDVQPNNHLIGISQKSHGQGILIVELVAQASRNDFQGGVHLTSVPNHEWCASMIILINAFVDHFPHFLHFGGEKEYILTFQSRKVRR